MTIIFKDLYYPTDEEITRAKEWAKRVTGKTTLTNPPLFEWSEKQKTEEVLRLRIKELEKENKELKEFIEKWTEGLTDDKV